ncbi:MAG: PD40 domain-containing protein [bacterium]|nr:PD40 domain-containing protein [bacterium]
MLPQIPCPKWIKGVSELLFFNQDGDDEIFTMNVDGSGLRQLTANTAHDFNPTWSPDGSKIAFQSYRNGQYEIYVMNADGSQQTRLTTNDAYDGMPDWSQMVKKIAFVSKPQQQLADMGYECRRVAIHYNSLHKH